MSWNSWESEISYKITYKINIGNAICQVWHFRAKPSSLGNGQKHCKNQCFCPTKTAKTIPQWLESYDIFRFMCDSFKRLQPCQILSLIKISWCYYPQSTYVPEKVPDFYSWINVLVGANNLKTKNLANFRTRGLSAATGQGLSTCLITKCIYANQTSPYIHPYMVVSGQKQTNKQAHQVEIHERAMPVKYTPWHSSSLQTRGSWSFHGKQKTNRRSWNL